VRITTRASTGRAPRSFTTYRITLAYFEANPWSVTRSCQIAFALRPRSSPASMISRYGSHLLVARLRPSAGGGRFSAITTEPVIASMAGFESAAPAITGAEPVITSMAGFAAR
jgi:hypothetical protein